MKYSVLSLVPDTIAQPEHSPCPLVQMDTTSSQSIRLDSTPTFIFKLMEPNSALQQESSQLTEPRPEMQLAVTLNLSQKVSILGSTYINDANIFVTI